MEWLILILSLVILLGTLRFYPDAIAPHCPICAARFQSIPDRVELFSVFGWYVVWHEFVCPQCLYRWRRLEIVRRPKGINT